MKEETQKLIDQSAQLQREIVGSMNNTVQKSIDLGERLVKIKKDKSMKMGDAYDMIGINQSWGTTVIRAFYNKERYELGMSVERLAKKSPVTGEVPPIAHVGHNSGNMEWNTPTLFVELARKTMGSIDIDPASNEIAQKTVKAKIFFTQKDDGLRKKWTGNVWMNPPYAQPVIGEFIDKITTENISQAIVLVNNATETKWGQQLLHDASAVCFPKTRIKFINQNGEQGESPLQGQMICYLGDNKKLFVENFNRIGRCLIVEEQ